LEETDRAAPVDAGHVEATGDATFGNVRAALEIGNGGLHVR
jgi:hypothetical protein